MNLEELFPFKCFEIISEEFALFLPETFCRVQMVVKPCDLGISIWSLTTQYWSAWFCISSW
jgi:hypothetical protein